MDKTYENRHWEIDKVDNVLVGKLHFTQYYDDDVILSFTQDKDDEEMFWYTSDFLKVEIDCIAMVSPDEAMEEFESMIIDHIEDEIATLEDMKEKFNEERIY